MGRRRFFSFIHENWTIYEHPTQIAAYALWRLNWIHPFIEGNGRTARAACYYLICLRQEKLLGGTKIVPERIRENREPYYAGLKASDLAWEEGQYDVDELTVYLESLLKGQCRPPAALESLFGKERPAGGPASYFTDFLSPTFCYCLLNTRWRVLKSV